MENKKWEIVNGGVMVLGEKPESLSKHAFVSLTRGEGLNFAQLVINQVFTLLVMNQMKKTPGLLYAEVEGELKRGKGYGQTMTVWDGKTMPQLRNSGSHGFAMKFLGWVIHRKNTKTFYLTYKANGNIPTKDQATKILKNFGKYYDQEF